MYRGVVLRRQPVVDHPDVMTTHLRQMAVIQPLHEYLEAGSYGQLGCRGSPHSNVSVSTQLEGNRAKYICKGNPAGVEVNGY